MKKSHAHVLIKSIDELTQAMPSPSTQLVKESARKGMATIYENDKATEKIEVLERASLLQQHTGVTSRASRPAQGT